MGPMGVGRGMVGRVAWVRVENVEWSCGREVVLVICFFWEGIFRVAGGIMEGGIRTNLR